MKREELSQYLRRIGIDGEIEPSVEGLAAVQRAHLRTVPFENLDIVEGKIPLALDERSLFDKIVTRRRGGICYEQNLLFAAVLREIGFGVELYGGRHPKYGDDMDHVFLVVDVPGESGRHLADVGFATNFVAPLKYAVGVLQDDGRDRYMLGNVQIDGERFLRLWRFDGLEGDVEPVEMFTFKPQAREPEDCRVRCDWYSTAPESRFTQGPLVSIDAADGRRTLSANHFITTVDGVRTSVDIESIEQYERYLKEEFDL